MTGPDAALFLRLLVAHVLVDFYFQPDSWVKEKSENLLGRGLFLHCGLQAILTWLFSLRPASLWILPVVFLTHLLIDVGKVCAEEGEKNVPDGPRCWVWFVLDQILHGIVLVLVWVWLTSTLSLGDVFGFVLSPGPLVVLAGYLIVTRPLGFVVGRLTSSWQPEMKNEGKDGLARAGTWIGYLERSFIVTFILAGHWEGVGFLIAAKSVFRFSELRDGECRKKTEYILIGTMISFLAATLVSVGLSMLLAAVKAGPA